MMMTNGNVISNFKNVAVPAAGMLGLVLLLGQPVVGGGPLCRPPEVPEEPEAVAEPRGVD